jgi:hypothetical protein
VAGPFAVVVGGMAGVRTEGVAVASAVEHGVSQASEDQKVVAEETDDVAESIAVERPRDHIEVRHSLRRSERAGAGAGSEGLATQVLVTAFAENGWHFGASLAGVVCSVDNCSWGGVVGLVEIAAVVLAIGSYSAGV